MTRAEQRAVLLAGFLGVAGMACDADRQDARPEDRPRPARSEPAPLETEILEEAEVVTLEEAPEEIRLTASDFRPCGWSARWGEPGKAKPIRAGASVPEPKKRVHVASQLPRTKTQPAGAPVLEAIIDERGHVEEVSLIQSFNPPWPEGEAVLTAAVKQWRYEPVLLDGRAVPVCITITVRLDWK